MTHALAHRGPDEFGFHLEPGVALGHRRLSVIDLVSGRQPLCNEDGSVWVVFNGEIFNYVELRARLLKQGHVFRTQSDTETLVHLYEDKGPAFVDDLNGQFAFALWDRKCRRLVLARDRVGIRPLFHATLPDGAVLFGSEVKALLAHGALRAEIDAVALGQIATFWATVPPRTAFKDVQELGPGRMLVFEGERRTERKYWRHCFPREHEYEERSLDYWKRRVREALEDAVDLQLRSDVPVGTLLSGGLDSSILTALTRRRRGADLITFAVTFSDARFDEREHQRALARALGTRHREVEVSEPDIGRLFADVVWFAERPMTRTAPAPLLHLAGFVRESGIKVVLTGEGADEIFAGYDIFREDKVRRFWAEAPQSKRRPALLSKLYPYMARDPRSEVFWRSFFGQDLLKVADPYYSHRLRWRHSGQIKRFLAPDVVAQMQTDEALFAELEAYLDPQRETWHPLCRAQYLEFALFMSGFLLSAQGDRMMMAHSVESRVPFLDHRLIELAAQIPPKFKLRGLNEKYILKAAFGDLLPRSIVARPKQPYRAPIAPCFLGDRGNLSEELLSKDALERFGLVDAQPVHALLSKARQGRAVLGERDDMALAFVVSLQLLQQLFVADFRADRSSEVGRRAQVGGAVIVRGQ